MMGFQDRKSGESFTSRYIQMNLFEKEDSGSPTIKRSSKGDTQDSLIKYNSAGGAINEEKTTSELGEYLKVRVLAETKIGHLILLDETEDNERLMLLHPNGSYIDIIPSGKKDKTEGHLWQFVSKTFNLEIKENSTIIMHGNCNIKVDGNCNIDVGGSSTVTSKGPATVHGSVGILKGSSNTFVVS